MTSKIKHIDYPLVAEAHTPMYLTHKFWARKPHNVVSAYIQNYSKEGEIVLDPFAGSGVTAIEAVKLGRKGIATDLDPIATFITRATAMPVDIEAIKETFLQIKKACEGEITSLYEIHCKRCGIKTQILATIWDRETGKPLEIRYFCPGCKKRTAKKIDKDDKNLLKSIEKRDIPYWYPKTKLYYNSKPFLKQETVDSVDKLFTRRNLIALSILYNEIEKIRDRNIKNLFEFAFTSMVHLASKMTPVRPSRPYSSFWAMHSYWVPPVYMESNVWILFDSAVDGRQGLIRGKEDSNTQIDYYKEAKSFKDLKDESNIYIKTHNALELSKIIPSNSVDYVFTDPPYGGAIQYFELSTLWCSWLRMNSNWWRDEVTINKQQDKNFDYYHQMLYAAFLEIYKALKPEKWMTVTFHSTDIKVYNSIIRAAVFAGFSLEKIIYQPPARASAKGLLQPYGSAVGDYYIRFRKPRRPKGAVSTAEVSPAHFEKIVIQSAQRIIAERGEATAYTHILNGIYPELDRYGVLLGATEDIKEVLQKYLEKQFVLIDVLDKKGKVIGQKWWLKDPSGTKINLVPLHERVEKAVINVLNRNIIASFDDIQQEIFIAFSNALTPEKESIKAVLEEYAEPAGDGRWRLKTRVQERQKQHSCMIYYLARLGRKAGYNIWIGTRERGEKYQGETLSDLSLKNLKLVKKLPKRNLERIKAIDTLWLKKGKVIAAFEVENTTTVTEAVVRAANIPYQVHKVILIPDERENLFFRKIQEPGLEKLGVKSWKFIFYDDLSRLYEEYERKKKITIDELLNLSRPLRLRETKQRALNLFQGQEEV